MPKLGLTMQEGTITAWLAPEGTPVTEGTPLLTIEAEKVDTDVEAITTGVLHQVAAEGDTLVCGDLIGWILADDEDVPTAEEPAARRRIVASPNARRVARELDLDLATITGSGPGGRVLSEDVELFARSRPGDSEPDESPTGRAVTEIIATRGMRGTIARRMVESLRDSAQLTLGMEADADAMVALRSEFDVHDVPSYTDFVTAAVSRSLVEHRVLNSMLVGDEIHVLADIDIGVAVELDDGLVVPIVRGADQLGLIDLAAETKRLATGARERTLALADFEGGTFAVSSLGMFGVDFFTPIINPPNTAILGIGRIRDEVTWSGDSAARARRITLSLTFDHRVADGAVAARFLAAVRDRLESPEQLLARPGSEDRT